MAKMDRMTSQPPPDLHFHIRQWGRRGDPPLVLVMGLGAPLLRWPARFIDALVDRGLHVVAFDNRDAGRSTHLDQLGRVSIAALLRDQRAGTAAPPPYTLADMAADVLAVADRVGLDRIHVAGMSMGGMIAQTAAAIYPDRVASLVSIMSTTGNPDLPRPDPEAAAILYGPAPAILDHASLVDHLAGQLHYLAGRLSPSLDHWRLQVARELAHGYSPAGVGRQLAAVIAAGDRRAQIGTITAPALVLHGEADPLVRVEAGLDTASTIAGATFRRYADMAHHIPEVLAETLADDIAGFIHGLRDLTRSL